MRQPTGLISAAHLIHDIDMPVIIWCVTDTVSDHMIFCTSTNVISKWLISSTELWKLPDIWTREEKPARAPIRNQGLSSWYAIIHLSHWHTLPCALRSKTSASTWNVDSGFVLTRCSCSYLVCVRLLYTGDSPAAGLSNYFIKVRIAQGRHGDVLMLVPLHRHAQSRYPVRPCWPASKGKDETRRLSPRSNLP